MNARSPLGRLVLSGVLWHWCAMLYADGGAVRCSERRGDYRITVFTSPTPLRAGPVDISVFVQDVASGEPVPQARILVRATPRDHVGETLSHRATTAAATNKLYQAAVFDLPEPGWWDVEIVIEGPGEAIQVVLRDGGRQTAAASVGNDTVDRLAASGDGSVRCSSMAGAAEDVPSEPRQQRSGVSGRGNRLLRCAPCSVRGSDKKSGCHAGWERDNCLFGNASAQRR